MCAHIWVTDSIVFYRLLTFSDDSMTIGNVIIGILYNVLKEKGTKINSIKEHYLIN